MELSHTTFKKLGAQNCKIAWTIDTDQLGVVYNLEMICTGSKTNGVYLGFTLGLFYENLGPRGVYFGFTRGLLWVYLEITIEVKFMHWSVKQTCSILPSHCL